jgi:hypothetical protein
LRLQLQRCSNEVEFNKGGKAHLGEDECFQAVENGEFPGKLAAIPTGQAMVGAYLNSRTR